MGRSDTELSGYVAERLAKAEQGKVNAYYDLGLLYSTGQGVARDYVEAHKWFNLAAIQGVRRAAVDRTDLAREMSRSDIAKAQELARKWLTSH